MVSFTSSIIKLSQMSRESCSKGVLFATREDEKKARGGESDGRRSAV